MSPSGSGPPGSVPALHLVTDDAILARPDFRNQAFAALAAGGASLALHLRGPWTPGGKIFSFAELLRPGAEASGALLVVNDRVDVALAAGLQAVHLGERSLPVAEARRILGPGALVGASIHDPDAAAAAARDGSAWLFVGTLYSTPSHPHRPGRGGDAIRQVAAVVGVPLVGIGGVTVARVGEVLKAGAHGVAVIRGVWDAPDPTGAIGDYLVALA
jgi:thiamine-phosphate pyrophosphorylase